MTCTQLKKELVNWKIAQNKSKMKHQEQKNGKCGWESKRERTQEKSHTHARIGKRMRQKKYLNR